MILSMVHFLPRKEDLMPDKVKDIFLCEVSTESEAFAEMRHYLHLLDIESTCTFTQLIDLHNDSGETVETVKYVEMIDTGYTQEGKRRTGYFLIRGEGVKKTYFRDMKHFFCEWEKVVEYDFDEWSKTYKGNWAHWLLYYQDLCKRGRVNS